MCVGEGRGTVMDDFCVCMSNQSISFGSSEIPRSICFEFDVVGSGRMEV